ncbi:hypothetical protein CYMTET_15822 [Cymbomonas tetramitiformis]|uniref:Uncharacterized protein n=1 Tax=Cymbomonas tetramitiformis TaxID=36881 RepID=A0AAE0GDG7_9CHLO|nr:hypothetical protein CYMTET_15822 [Cymbomonas tetramitiformis]
MHGDSVSVYGSSDESECDEILDGPATQDSVASAYRAVAPRGMPSFLRTPALPLMAVRMLLAFAVTAEPIVGSEVGGVPEGGCRASFVDYIGYIETSLTPLAPSVETSRPSTPSFSLTNEFPGHRLLQSELTDSGHGSTVLCCCT